MAVEQTTLLSPGTPGTQIIQETSLRHPDYAGHEVKWNRIRDCVNGSDAVKAKRTLYLPKLTGQSKDEYNAYLTRALFVSFTDRTLKGLVGLMTEREPNIEAPDEMRPYFEDVDNQGTSFFELLRWVTEEVVAMGRTGLLIDFPVEGGRAYTIPYAAENIINWNTDPIFRNLNMLVLQELRYWPQPSTMHFLSRYVEYRLLRLNSGSGMYEGEVWRRSVTDTSSGALNRRAVISPVVRGDPIDIIPFTFITSEGITTELVKPPMLDIVDVNLSHFRTSADLEHGRHFTALPVPVVTGVDSDSPLRVGSEQAWVLPPHQAKAYYLEFTGQGLQSLEGALKEKSDQMAVFSTRMMDNSARGSESPDNVRIRHSSDAANMTRIVETIENAFNRHYNLIRVMEGIPGEVKITLNKHFLDARMPATELREIVKAFTEGAINEETLIFNLTRGDIMQTDTLDRKVDRTIPGPREEDKNGDKPTDDEDEE